MKVIIVGAGGTSRDLLRRLGDLWQVTVIDSDPERLALAGKVRDFEGIQGDGSSRVVLQRAGLESADAVVAATDDDAVNLEISEIAREAGILRVVGVARNPDLLAAYREMDIPAHSPSSLAARQVEVSLEPRRVSSTSFANGKAEAIEFRIAPDSPVKGIALRDLHSESWLVAAILREGRLIVPHGNTVLQTDDLVTVVGASSDFSLIVRTFTAGEARFPIDFGKSVAVVVDTDTDLAVTVAEAVSLTRNSNASSLIVLHRALETIGEDSQRKEIETKLIATESLADGVEVRRLGVDGKPSRALDELAGESVGTLVVPAPRQGSVIAPLRAARLVRSLEELDVPVLFSRGSFPYAAIVAPARATPSGRAAARAAIDLAAYAKGAIVGVAVVPPQFLTGVDEREDALAALTRVREEAAVQGVPVRRKLRQGNPVRVIDEMSETANLVALGFPDTPPSFFRPGIVGHVVARSGTSVLVVPSER